MCSWYQIVKLLFSSLVESTELQILLIWKMMINLVDSSLGRTEQWSVMPLFVSVSCMMMLQNRTDSQRRCYVSCKSLAFVLQIFLESHCFGILVLVYLLFCFFFFFSSYSTLQWSYSTFEAAAPVLSIAYSWYGFKI